MGVAERDTIPFKAVSHKAFKNHNIGDICDSRLRDSGIDRRRRVALKTYILHPPWRRAMRHDKFLRWRAQQGITYWN